LNACGETSPRYGGIFDLAQRQSEIDEIEIKAADPNLWDDPANAQELMQRLSALNESLAPWKEIIQGLDDLDILLEMAADDPDADAELESEYARVRKLYDTLELQTLLGGEHDANNASVEINAGAGGTEANDWAQMLMRMYLRWIEKRGFKVELVDELEGESAGIKNATLIVRGPLAYGYMKSERGVHRLVRISPYDANKRRHTSFASVGVSPELDDDAELEINPDEIRVDTYRSSGAGGQHVNKTESAIRITHLPTGIVVTCQNERSQIKNRATAMKVLQGRLAEIRERERDEAMSALTGEQKKIEWGAQIRSYVFQPYTMVKDLRTGVETGNIIGVMDGDLDPFMEGYLRKNAERSTAGANGAE
jgi:peptide chain release factor 2